MLQRTLKGGSPCVQTTAMEYVLHNTEEYNKAKRSLRWAIFNGIISAILWYDVMNTCPKYSFSWRLVEVIIMVALTLNTLFHMCLYLKRVSFLSTVSVTPNQKKLIGITERNPYISVSTPRSQGTPVSDVATPMNLSAASWLSSGSSPGNYTMTASSWEYLPNMSRTSMSSISPKVSADHSHLSPKAFDFSNFSNSSNLIDSEESLAHYLCEYEEYERNYEQSISSVWKNSSGRFKMENSGMKGCTYQLATPSPGQKSTSGAEPDESGGNFSSSLKSNQDIWVRLGVDRMVLTQWNANLRRWLSETILERLVKEMKTMDQALTRCGLSDIKIGVVGLDRLKKTLQMQQVAYNMPTFPHLLRFLEFFPNQEYLVTRIKDLAKGGCMSEFRWNGGGKLLGKDWEDHFPTDAALVMFLLATYLDTQLPPLPHNPEGQPFTSEYLVKVPNKVPTGKNCPIIQEVQVKPPHYVLHVQGEKMDVGKGRNNFFHTVLLFLYQMSEKEHSMLGRVNMGPSGINILWVIDR